MPQRFGEEISEQDAYNTARNALTCIQDLSGMDRLADTPIKRKALADERAARAGK